MIHFFIALFFLFLPIVAPAATLTYTGQNYSTFTYTLGDAKPADWKPFRRSYDTSMFLSLELELSDPLVANTVYDFDYGSHLEARNGFAPRITILKKDYFDGINDFAKWGLGELSLTTDASRRVVSWDFWVGLPGGGFDFDAAKSNSSTGDFAEYDYEYESLTSFDYYGFERATAKTNLLGTWSGSAVAAVPLPLSSALLLTGVGAFGLVGRKAGKLGKARLVLGTGLGFLLRLPHKRARYALRLVTLVWMAKRTVKAKPRYQA